MCSIVDQHTAAVVHHENRVARRIVGNREDIASRVGKGSGDVQGVRKVVPTSGRRARCGDIQRQIVWVGRSGGGGKRQSTHHDQQQQQGWLTLVGHVS